MTGLELILAHLVGDYVLQNDWQANNKTAAKPTGQPPIYPGTGSPVWSQDEIDRWEKAWASYYIAPFACTVHCLLYTFAVFAFTWYWMPWWGLLLCFLIHWPVDRFRLARKWMENVSGQHAFANGVFAPWSIILVDNIFHLLTLYGIWLLTKVGT